VGCSTSGEIAGTQVHDASVSVAVARFDHTRLRRAFTIVDGVTDSFQAGVRLAAQLVDEGLRAVFVLSDGLCVNGTPLVDGLARHLPAGVQITGGLAGDLGHVPRARQPHAIEPAPASRHDQHDDSDESEHADVDQPNGWDRVAGSDERVHRWDGHATVRAADLHAVDAAWRCDDVGEADHHRHGDTERADENQPGDPPDPAGDVEDLDRLWSGCARCRLDRVRPVG